MKTTHIMTRLILLSLLLSLSIFAKTANAQEPDIAAWRTGYGAEIIGGTHGYGVAFSLRKNYYYSLRFLLLTYENQVKMEENNNNNSYEYAYKSDFQNYALLANIYPVGDRIFISSGVYSLDMRYDRDGYARRSFTEANDENYLLEADYKTAVRYKGNAPYLGIGMGTKRHSKSRITLRAEIGVIFMPSPDDVQVSFGTIQAVGEASLESDASLAAQSELRDKASGAYLAKVKRDADAFKYYPVLEAGITYNF